MPIEKNQTTIQLLKILSSQTKPKRKRNKVYPKAIENRYKNKLSGYFKPLIDYVNKFINENNEELLRGDSVKFDSVPGETFRKMVKSLQKWLGLYMPEENSGIYAEIRATGETLKDYEDMQFNKQIGISIKEQAEWWDSMVESWADTNYQLIRSNAYNFVSKINNIVEQAVVNGTSVSALKKEIQKATKGLSDAKCRLLARDQIGKLQGQISQAQMEELGLEMYIWSTSNDERVRDSHREMEGLLCRWDDANVYSEDGGKTWIDRPSGAVRMHPGQDIQCRCMAIAFFPELDEILS